MMAPPEAPLLDSACYITPHLEAQDLVGKTVRREEHGACLQHEFCWAASRSSVDIQIDQHTT